MATEAKTPIMKLSLLYSLIVCFNIALQNMIVKFANKMTFLTSLNNKDEAKLLGNSNESMKAGTII